MKMYKVSVVYYIPADDSDDLDSTMYNAGITSSEYYGHHDVVDVEEYEEDEED